MIFKHCLICDSLISHKETICFECSKKLESSYLNRTFTTCSKCGYPLIDKVYSCPECSNRKGNYIFSLYDYRESFAREVLEHYKFKNEKKFSKLYASVIKPYIANYDVVIPVPSSEKSLKNRGWDQMVEICKQLKCSNIKYVFKNVNSFSEQKFLNREQRIINSIDKYCLVDVDIDVNSKILVIDDITTTGATINSCINLLKDHGFKNVDGLTLYAQI